MTNKTMGDPMNSTHARETAYTDTEFPWVRYTGTRRNPTGPRNIWYVHDTRLQNGSKPTGPFPALKLAWMFVHGKNPYSTQNGPEETPKTVDSEPEPHIRVDKSKMVVQEIQQELFPEIEIVETDQLVEFSCPHCGKSIISLVGKA